MVERYLDEELNQAELTESLDKLLARIEMVGHQNQTNDLQKATELIESLYQALENDDRPRLRQLGSQFDRTLVPLRLEEGDLPPNLARLLHQVKRYTQALVELDQVLKALSDVEADLNDLKAASEYYRGLSDVNPELLEIFFRGVEQMELGLDGIRTAIACYDRDLLGVSGDHLVRGATTLREAETWIIEALF